MRSRVRRVEVKMWCASAVAQTFSEEASGFAVGSLRVRFSDVGRVGAAPRRWAGRWLRRGSRLVRRDAQTAHVDVVLGSRQCSRWFSSDVRGDSEVRLRRYRRVSRQSERFKYSARPCSIMQKFGSEARNESQRNTVDGYVVLPRSVVLCTSKSERAQCMSNLMTQAALRMVEKGNKNAYVVCTMR